MPRRARASIKPKGGRTLRVTQLPLDRLDPFPTIDQLEMLQVRAALARTGNNKAHAAELLGVTREGLRRKMIRFRMQQYKNYRKRKR